MPDDRDSPGWTGGSGDQEWWDPVQGTPTQRWWRPDPEPEAVEPESELEPVEPDEIPAEGTVDRTGVLLQLFHWYLPDDGSWWRTVAERAQELADAGFTAVWLPPAYKGHAGGYDVGYGVYDLYDLGEFDQKGSVRTRYGTKDEYLAAIEALHERGLLVYADIVLNHRLGGDEKEAVRATPYSVWDRRQPSGPTRWVEVWTRYTFPGRAGAYDERQLDASYFSAVDHDDRVPDQPDTIYLFEGKEFDPDVDEEYGNYSYLMGADIDHSSADVRQMLIDWSHWYIDFTGVDGLRMDAVKHMPTWVMPAYLDAFRAHLGATLKLPVVGEYWSPHLSALEHFIDATGGTMALFDVPLHNKFHQIGRDGAAVDLRTMFDGTLVSSRPDLAVTFVDNHDSQPLQALEATVAEWFKPAAYATILLRRDGLPCVFGADYDGSSYSDWRDDARVDVHLASHREFIDLCLQLRAELGSAAEQEDHLLAHDGIAWVRRTARLTVVVIVGNAGEFTLDIPTGRPRRRFTEVTGLISRKRVVSRADGTGRFPVPGGGVTIWVSRIGRSVPR